ncbi:hypothetical protein [Phycicoccus sp. Soil803]|uniref:hypothetical protein n=1 Tax=Phycicoccus sp. Soil803 TaxID=1736415 RepID=UPI0012F923C5|nr:hypothetical protein [Phycicoccus sp. Soil803]
MNAAGVPIWVRLLTNVSLPAGFLAVLWFGGNWSSSQAAAAFGLYGLCFGAFHQFRRPTTPGTRRVFALLFVLVCLGALFVGDRASADDVVIAIACVGGWTVGLGLAASFDPNDGAPVKRSFSGHIIRRG